MSVRNQATTMLAIAFCLFTGFGVSHAELSEGLISAWTFDDGIAEDVVGGNDGEIKGGVEAVDGKFNKALSFNGEDGFVQIQHSASMNALENALTVSAWVFIRQSGWTGVIFKGDKSGWSENYLIRIGIHPGQGQSFIWGVGTGALRPWTKGFGTEKWIHLCMTADGATVTAYVDGMVGAPALGENPYPRAAPYPLVTDQPLEFGVFRFVGTPEAEDTFLNGIIDEVYLWERALSADEITELARGDRPEFVFPVEITGKLSALWGSIK